MKSIMLDDALVDRLNRIAEADGRALSRVLTEILNSHEFRVAEQRRKLEQFIGSVDMPITDLSEHTRDIFDAEAESVARTAP